MQRSIFYEITSQPADKKLLNPELCERLFNTYQNPVFENAEELNGASLDTFRTKFVSWYDENEEIQNRNLHTTSLYSRCLCFIIDDEVIKAIANNELMSGYPGPLKEGWIKKFNTRWEDDGDYENYQGMIRAPLGLLWELYDIGEDNEIFMRFDSGAWIYRGFR
jgi:hypothetical protein